MPRWRDAGRPRGARGDAVRGRRGPLDAATEAVLLGRLADARGALLKAAARLAEVQVACLRSWDPWIHTGRVTGSARRSLLIGPDDPSSLRKRLRVLHGRIGCPGRLRARAVNAATLAADFAALPLRPAWLLGQLDRAPATPDLALARAAAERWLAARNALVDVLHGFVVMLARRASTAHLPLEDRVQAGVLALTVAIDRFDATRGTRVTTYLGPVVERAMRRLGRATARSAVVPSPGIPTNRLASSPAGRDRDERANGRRQWCHEVTVVTIDTRGGDGAEPLAERLVDPEIPTPEDLAILRIDVARARAELARLGPRDREILRLLFGLGGIEPRDLRGAGAAAGVSAATVRRICDRALARLAQAFARECDLVGWPGEARGQGAASPAPVEGDPSLEFPELT